MSELEKLQVKLAKAEQSIQKQCELIEKASAKKSELEKEIETLNGRIISIHLAQNNLTYADLVKLLTDQ